MVGPLQKNLERLIVAKQRSRWMPGLRSGRVNPSSLYKLKTGDDRVFRRRDIQGETKDVAVSLVVDCSGSMGGARIATAMASVYAMAQVLEKIGVTYEVIGFTTGDELPYSVKDELRRDEEKMGRNFSRTETIYMPIFKGFGERLKVEQRKRFAYAPHKSFLANNIDGECIEIAALRLLGRPEHGKVMFVLSDGQPAAYGNGREQSKHLKGVVKKYIKLGIELFGIGIQTNAVEKYYPDYVVLDDIAELPNKVMSQLSRVMLGK
ncbi:MAG: hypothetical protein HRT93_10875 [Piscirickettsiaceae bacterium]|nr:hypothetical protein [Piscirickettsiaceae bacterium]